MKKKSVIFGLIALVLLALVIGLYRFKKPSDKIDQIMNANKGFNFPPGFPPDPGEAGKKTLEGIDSDHDGLRDDLQRWIYARFPNEPKKRTALKQMAISYQKNLIIPHERKEMELASERLSKAIACLDEIFGDQNNEMEFVKAKALNTRERTEQFLKVDKWFDGMTFEESSFDEENTCEN